MATLTFEIPDHCDLKPGDLVEHRFINVAGEPRTRRDRFEGYFVTSGKVQAACRYIAQIGPNYHNELMFVDLEKIVGKVEQS